MKVTSVTIKQMPIFKKAYKRLHANQKLDVDDAIRAIVANPKIGQEKKGDLAKIFGYKFKIHRQQMLLAYEWNLHNRLLLALGSYENFYRNLKKYL